MEPPRLEIGQHLLQWIREHCLEEKPFEACGILTGHDGKVSHAYATDNARHSPIFYEVEPCQQSQVLTEMAARGEEVVAIYHSHPTSDAYPSANDIQLAVHYPNSLRVIISLAGPTKVRAFLIRRGQVREVLIEASATTGGEWHDLRGGTERFPASGAGR